MKSFSSLRVALLCVAALLLVLACSTGGQAIPSLSSSASSAASSGAGGATGAGACKSCLSDQDCSKGSRCGQFGGDIYCAADCSGGVACASGSACTPVSGADGSQQQLCVPIMNACGNGQGGAPPVSGSSASGNVSASAGSGMPQTCGSLDGPTVKACCASCKPTDKCQLNGCYGGWWCNVDSCKCQSPPANCGSGAATSAASSSSGASSGSGGPVDSLCFAVVGDTRPAMYDDTANYPTAVISKIWQAVEAQSPKPSFAIATGDYMFAASFGSQGAVQLDKYLAARAAFTGPLYPALGNHECTGSVNSNCTAGNLTNNYKAFMSKMLAPLGISLPYYTINMNGTGNAWTAKFVFVAANAWDATQSAWLSAELSKPTTYTFVVRHEGSLVTAAPGVSPSAAIMAQHPLTLLIVGHTHTYAYYANEKQLVVGNGGAPLTGAGNYGYVIACRNASGSLDVKEYDYSTNAVNQAFTVQP